MKGGKVLFLYAVCGISGQILFLFAPSAVGVSGYYAFASAGFVCWLSAALIFFRKTLKPGFKETNGEVPLNLPSIARGFRRWQAGAAFLLIMASAFYFRMHRLEEVPGGLWYDEAINLLDARSTAGGDIRIIYNSYGHPRQPLYIYFTALIIKLIPESPLALRLSSALFSVITIAVMFLAVSVMFGFPTAFFSCFLFATSFWITALSRTGFRAVTSPLFEILLLWLFYSWLSGKRKETLNAFLAGAVTGFGCYTYLAFYSLLITAPVIFLFLGKKLRSPCRSGAAFTCALLITLSPLVYHYSKYPEDLLKRGAEVSVLNSPAPAAEILKNVLKTAAAFNLYTGGKHPRSLPPARALLNCAAGFLFITGFLWGFGKKGKYRLVFIFLAASLIPSILSSGAPHPLRLVNAAVPVFILCGAALSSISGKRIVKTAVPLLFLLLSLAGDHRAYFSEYAENPELWYAFEKDACAAVPFILEKQKSYSLYFSKRWENNPVFRLVPAIKHEGIRKDGRYDMDKALFLISGYEIQNYEWLKKRYPELKLFRLCDTETGNLITCIFSKRPL
ncbi:MAG: glycosyltransferase family 39 protein [bacterium]